MSGQARLGVDIGGTFTDVVLKPRDGAQFSIKVLTTYGAPEDAIVDGLHQVCQGWRVTRYHRSGHPRDHTGDQCTDRAPR